MSAVLLTTPIGHSLIGDAIEQRIALCTTHFNAKISFSQNYSFHTQPEVTLPIPPATGHAILPCPITIVTLGNSIAETHVGSRT